jgi:hypothetical protein
MTTFRVEFDGVDDLVAALEAKAAALEAAAADAAHAMSTAFIAAAKRNATGPPRIAGRERRTRARKGQPSRVLAWSVGGPGVVTGFLRNSIQVRQDHATGPGRWETTVHPGGPYYRRLEFGFRGRDSLGRRYDQPAYPFMRPALDTAHLNRYRAAAVRVFRKAFSGK